MRQKKSVIWKNLAAGINAVLPIIILVFLLNWALKIIFQLINPFIIFLAPRPEDQTIFVKFSVLIIVLVVISIVGAFLQKSKGRRRFARFETRIFKVLPGYTMVKEIVLQFLGTKHVPFSSVVLVRPFNSAVQQIAFVTDEHADGSYTVFTPTGPNPTSGNIYIIPGANVEILDVPVEQAMKTIISCGIGSRAIAEIKNNTKKA